MVKQLIFLAGLYSIFNETVSAQCDPGAVQKINGKWIKDQDAVSGASEYGFPRAQVPALLAKMDKYIIPVKDFWPQPVGLDISWYKVIGFRPLYSNGPQPARVITNFNQFYCAGGRQHNVTLAVIDIESNSFFSFLPVTGTGKYFNDKEIMLMPFQIGTVQGYPYFEPTYSGETERTHHRSVLLSMPGKLPYRVLTRREVLAYMKQQLDKGKKEMMELIDQTKIRPKAEQEAEKQSEAKFYRENYSDPGVAERYLANFQTDEQKRDEKKKKAEQDFGNRYARLDKVEKMYDKELDSAAVLYEGNLAWGTINDNWTFVQDKIKDDHLCTPDCKHGHQFAILNDAYFDKKLSRGIPQFITVTFNLRVTNSNKFRDPFFEKMKEEWEKKFNFASLAELLGK